MGAPLILVVRLLSNHQNASFMLKEPFYSRWRGLFGLCAAVVTHICKGFCSGNCLHTRRMGTPIRDDLQHPHQLSHMHMNILEASTKSMGCSPVFDGNWMGCYSQLRKVGDGVIGL